MDYEELVTTATEHLRDMQMDSDMDGAVEATTLGGPVVETSRVLGLYDIFIPMLGVFIIVLNLAVVISSGLILKKGKLVADIFASPVGMYEKNP